MTRKWLAHATWVAAVLAAVRSSGELIPTPDFSHHPIPTSQVPAASHVAWEYVDVAALLIALALASYWALVTRSRRNLFFLTIASLLWFGFWRQGCVCSVGSTQNIALALCRSDYAIPISVVAFFAIPLLFTLFFGRTFCAAVCPLGAVQELVAVRSVGVPRWLDHTLGLLPFIYLGLAVLFAGTGTAFVICRYDPFVALFRLNGNANMLIFGGCLLLIGLFVGRPYCRYLCPYGAILSVLSRLARWQVQIPPTECIQCRLCEDVCPYDAIQPPTVDPSPGDLARGRRRLGALLLSSPLIVGLFAWWGTWLGAPLSRLDTEVRLAEQVFHEEQGVAKATTDASEAFRTSRRPVQELYLAAIGKRDRYGWLGTALGAWVGLVINIKLVSLTVRRRRSDYRPDRAGCVSCGRCFWYCPVEQVRLGLIKDTAEIVGKE